MQFLVQCGILLFTTYSIEPSSFHTTQKRDFTEIKSILTSFFAIQYGFSSFIVNVISEKPSILLKFRLMIISTYDIIPR